MAEFLAGISEVLLGGVCDNHKVDDAVGWTAPNHLLIISNHWTTSRGRTTKLLTKAVK
jgi:hypothetical protein